MTVAFSRGAWIEIARETLSTDRPLSLRISRLLIEDRSERPVCELPHPLVESVMDAYRRFDAKVRAVAGGR